MSLHPATAIPTVVQWYNLEFSIVCAAKRVCFKPLLDTHPPPFVLSTWMAIVSACEKLPAAPTFNEDQNMAVVELAHDEDLGVFFIKCSSAMPIRRCLCQAPQRGFWHPGIWAAAVCLRCQIPPLCFSGSCSCFQLAPIPASHQCRRQPFPHGCIFLRARMNSILLLYVCEFSCRHLCLCLVLCVGCLYAGMVTARITCRKKKDTEYMIPELRYPLCRDEIRWRMTDFPEFRYLLAERAMLGLRQ